GRERERERSCWPETSRGARGALGPDGVRVERMLMLKENSSMPQRTRQTCPRAFTALRIAPKLRNVERQRVAVVCVAASAGGTRTTTPVPGTQRYQFTRGPVGKDRKSERRA